MTAQRDEKLQRLMEWAARTVKRIDALPDLDQPSYTDPPPVRCPRCGQYDCEGPTVAANRGGCRMDTWADVG